jgi:hypothetical protein
MDATENPTPTDLDRTRENWLRDAVKKFRTLIEEVSGIVVPDVRVSMGYGGIRYERDVAAVCYRRDADEFGLNQIFISPAHGNAVKVLESLLHELIHAALDNEDGHKGRFAEYAVRLGFDGPFTVTPASPGLKDELELLAIELGAFPHGKLTARQPAPVPGTVTVGGGNTITSSGGSDRNRWISFYCDTHASPIRMSAQKAERCVLICIERDAVTGQPCCKPLHRK